jgi:hypothetical protein
MPKSTGRKVARAASTGGGKVSYGHRPYGFYSLIAVIVVIGVALIAYSRYEYQHPSASSSTPPTTSDHWRAAFAFDICGKVEPNPPAPSKKTGITTTGDGVIDIHPLDSAEEGKHATLGLFVADYPGMELSSNALRYPGKKLYKNGDRCGSAPGHVQVDVWSSLAASSPRVLTSNVDKLRLEDGQLITIAFVPKGAKVPEPPSRTELLKAVSTTTTTTPKTTTTSMKSSPSSSVTTSTGATTSSTSSSSSSTAKASGSSTSSTTKG